MTKELDLNALALGDIMRPGDSVMWDQADAEPVPLTQALIAQRDAIGAFSVFLGVTNSDTLLGPPFRRRSDTFRHVISGSLAFASMNLT